MSTFNGSKPKARRGTGGFGRSLTPVSNVGGSSERGAPFCPEIIDASGKAIVRYVFFVSSDADLGRLREEVRRDYKVLSKYRTGLAIRGRGLEYS